MSPRLPLAAAALAFVVGCPKGAAFDTGEPVPEFSLEDANPSSASYGRLVSPSDLRGAPSVWYFGHGS